MSGSRFSIRPDLRSLLVGLLAIICIVTGIVFGHHTGGASAKLSAKDLIAADPPPALFTDSAISPTADAVAAAHKDANTRIHTWVSLHGTRPNDATFIAWVQRTFPAPPTDLSAQMPEVVALSKTRTSSGVKAATWLETHGKKDIWKLYAHDQGELLDPVRAKALKAEEKAVLKMSKQIADTLGTRYGSSAPYVRQPPLRPDHKVIAGQKCPCSYPSRHATAGAASETLLGYLQPRMDAQYRYFEAEIDYSRIYMAGHFPADISAGALLGDLIGDYFLITHEGLDPAALR